MILKKNVGWSFPTNDDGQQNGFNDAGIETFKDNRIYSLAREVVQNSCDAAAIAMNRPVEVHFQLLEIPVSVFPGTQDLRKAIGACALYWKSSKQTVAFCEEALDVLAGPMLPVMKISDFNTTGVRIGNVNDVNSEWFKLTKAVGASDKSEGKLGSFGIGKHAPFACSDLRTVFYGTKDDQGATGFQGVCKLPSHKSGKFVTQGTGYYGNRVGNRPLLDFGKVPPIFERKKTGADVYVMGFHSFPDWEDGVVKAVIESFFVAIHNGQLIVKVGKTSLNKTNLPSQIKKHYGETDPHFFADQYYSALISDDAAEFVEDDFMGYGRIRLRLLEDKSFKKKVAMLRRSGMKIFDKGNFQTPLRFAGVFTAEGEKLDALLRELEPPSHDQWREDRGDDPALSKKLLARLYRWVHDRVHELISTEDQTEVDAEGISQYLPDEIEDDAKGTPLQTETLQDEPAPVLDMRIRSSPRATAPMPELDIESQLGDEGDETEGAPAGPPSGVLGEGSGDGDGTGTGKGTTPTGSGGHPHPDNNHKRIEIANVRIYCSDPATGRYRVLFQPESGDARQLRVFVIGEVGAEPAPIKAFSVNGEAELSPTGERGVIAPILLPQGKRASLDIILEDSLRCALGVTAYAS